MHVTEGAARTQTTQQVEALSDCLLSGLLGSMIFNTHLSIFPAPHADLDTLVYLAMQKSEYLDNVDFVPQSVVVQQQEHIIASSDSSQVIVKSGSCELKLEAVTMMQWTAANSCNLANLLHTGKLSLNNVGHYLAYTVKISEFTRRSFRLKYDKEY